MEKKINIADLLKDCPKGMELYSTIYGTVYLERVIDIDYTALIHVKTSCNADVIFYPDGKFNTYYADSEMTLFPSKNVRTWEGFVPPCKFKDGDVVFTHANCLKVGVGNAWISIFKEKRNGGVATYIDYAEDGSDYYSDLDGDKAFLCMESDIIRQRLSTEEEKQKLFQAIKENGYRWNAETKTLEKLIVPKFKVGDRIKNSDNFRSSIVVEIKDDYFIIKTLDGLHNSYLTDKLPFSKQHEWILVPNKFDITTFKPFDKVLVRGDVGQRWTIDFFGFMDNKKGHLFVCVGHYVAQCIPYEGNEHLLGTSDECDDYYKNWK